MSSIRGATMLAASAIIAASAFASGASAADLFGSVKDGYAPLPVTSPAPSWYFRVDGAYGAYDEPIMVEHGIFDLSDTEIEGQWSLGGGVGYYFTKNIRGDVTVEHRFETDATGTLRDNNVNISGVRNFGLKSTVVMFNGYYDFDNRSFFTPYIGVGLGIANHSTTDGTVTLHGGGTGTIAGESTTHVAGALMAGASLALLGGTRSTGSFKDAPVASRNLVLDVGYRFLYLGETTTGPLTTPNGNSDDPTLQDIHAHEIRFGLRYDFR